MKLTKAIIFICSQGNDDEHVWHSKTDNIENMDYEKADKVVEEVFE